MVVSISSMHHEGNDCFLKYHDNIFEMNFVTIEEIVRIKKDNYYTPSCLDADYVNYNRIIIEDFWLR